MKLRMALGRPIDFNYSTNKIITILTGVVFLAGTGYRLITTGEIPESLLWGASAGIAVFLAWAVGRELDPDYDATAFIAAGLTVVAVVLWDLPCFLILFWFLLAGRVVNRTTGLEPGMFDVMLLTGLGAWLVFRGNWGLGLITIAALVLNSILPGERQRSRLGPVFGVLETGIIIVAIATKHAPLIPKPLSVGIAAEETAFSSIIIVVACLLCLSFIPLIIGSRRLSSKSDATEEPLIPIRVQTAQILAIVTGVAVFFRNGPQGLYMVAPLWACALGAVFLRTVKRIIKR